MPDPSRTADQVQICACKAAQPVKALRKLHEQQQKPPLLERALLCASLRYLTLHVTTSSWASSGAQRPGAPIFWGATRRG